MCIRDSLRAVTYQLNTIGDIALAQGVKGHLRVVRIVFHEAVSYTHLRAHETVLDLVCRLLLDKKHLTQYYTPTHTTKRVYNMS